jgi:alanine dehydrogenase
MLFVGIPREVKPEEKRVGIAPPGVSRLRAQGIPVLVEGGAGLECEYSDEDYRRAGAEIVGGAAALYKKAGLIKKVKEPLPSEWNLLRAGQIVFSFLHLGAPENRELLETLLQKRVTAIGFETVEKEGRTILLEPMSEIAGRLAGYFAGFFRTHVRVERGEIVYPSRLLEKLESIASIFPETPENLFPGKSVVFGGGTVGENAVDALVRMGGEVDLIEKRKERRKVLQERFRDRAGRIRIWGLEEDVSDRLKAADVWIGAVHQPGEKAPLILSPEELERFTKGAPKLILDIAVDQGGNFPGTVPTTYDVPLFIDAFGNMRFAVSNIPSLCRREATQALDRLTLPYLAAMARDWRQALRDFPELRRGLQTAGGKLVHEAVARAHSLSWEPFRE